MKGPRSSNIFKINKVGLSGLLIFLAALSFAARALAAEVPLEKEAGVYRVAVRINRVITLKFILDTGASEVVIPADVARTLVRANTIRETDFLPGKTYKLADGSELKSTRFVIRELDLGKVRIHNVPCSIAPPYGDLLLGQSLLERFDSWTLNNKKHVLIVGSLMEGPRLHHTMTTSPASKGFDLDQREAQSLETLRNVLPAGSGNFKYFRMYMKHEGFIHDPDGDLDGLVCYRKPDILIWMRNCGGYCCDSTIFARPMSYNALEVDVLLVYGSLQETLESEGKKSIESRRWAARTARLIDRIFANLKRADRTEFAFDHLHVRAQSASTSQASLEPGTLYIRLWIP